MYDLDRRVLLIIFFCSLQIHGIINAISWGILLPIGIMAARYLRPFEFADPAWFYLHVFCQVTGYAGGTAGWVLGLRLQKFANPIKYYHRNLGISIWALATFQVLNQFVSQPSVILISVSVILMSIYTWSLRMFVHARAPRYPWID